MAVKAHSSKKKMQVYRSRLREQGLRPVQIWVPDVNARGFSSEIRRQIRRLNPSHETEVLDFIAAVSEERGR